MGSHDVFWYCARCGRTYDEVTNCYVCADCVGKRPEQIVDRGGRPQH